MIAVLLEAASGNLLTGRLPESLGLFMFGIVLVVFAGGLRWILGRHQSENAKRKIEE